MSPIKNITNNSIYDIDKRLLRFIDTSMLNLEASIAGKNERYTKGKTSHTIHVWWARRPHLAMRIVVFASLCKRVNKNAMDLILDISGNYILTEDKQKIVEDLIASEYNDPPKVLDMFGGGGTIPFEVASLGAKSYSTDINPLSVFIQKSYLEYFQIGDKTHNIGKIKEAGDRILDAYKQKTSVIFPRRGDNGPIVYLWTYTNRCQCGYVYFLSKRPWIDKKNKEFSLALKVENTDTKQIMKLVSVKKKNTREYSKNYMNKSVFKTKKCPKCNHPITVFDINNFKDTQIGVFYKENPGKSFKLLENVKLNLDSIENELLNKIELNYNTFTDIPKWSGITNPTLYGITSYHHIYNQRQRIAILMMIQCLDEEYSKQLKFSKETATLVISILSSFIDQLVDWNSRISMWISENMQIGRSFSGPGIPMYWDYAEIDPVLNGPANLYKKLDRIIKGLEFIPKMKYTPVVMHGEAQNLPFDDDFFDAIITDPPYYDNIYYNILANFIYSWKKILLEKYLPYLFHKENTDNPNELMASKQKWKDQSHNVYIDSMTATIKESSRVLKYNGVFSFIYTHNSYLGWDAILYPFQISNFYITSVQPLSIERKARPRGMNSNAVNTSLIFVAHKQNKTKQLYDADDFDRLCKEIFKKIFITINSIGWEPKDIGIALFGNALGILMNYQAIHELSERLKIFDKIIISIQNFVPAFNLTTRPSL